MTSPFVVFRQQLDVYHVARAAGWSDGRYVDEVERADDLVAAVAGTGFVETPVVMLETPLDRSVVAKVETGGVGGSHKARHLFGLLLHLMIDDDQGAAGSPLAIASCGNAALGAATVAGAVDRPLRVFVPVDADPLILADLERLGATVEVCERTAGSTGDPCMEALHEAVASGDRPFTVQGPLAPAVIDGGRTLGLELASQLRSLEIEPADLYIQIGGGALATAVMDGLERADRSLRLHPVQASSAHPYVAAWSRLADRFPPVGDGADRDSRIDAVLEAGDDAMRPWPEPPRSVATGILDDVTYDWKTVMRHQVRSGGWPVLASEDHLIRATELAAAQVTPPPDATGAAGLAGLLADDRAVGERNPAVVLLTGVDRSWLATRRGER